MKQPHDIRTKLKRQIEIVGLSSDPTSWTSVIDLSILFDCEELTIKRDLQELRSAGIDIHSVPGKGVCSPADLDPKTLGTLIAQYAALSVTSSTIDKATVVLVQKQKLTALRNLVTIQRCIDGSLIVRFDYEKTEGEISRGRELRPGRLFCADGQWRLIARTEGTFKQFLLTKMQNVRQTDTPFRRIPEEEIDALFAHSFRSFLGTERINVRLRLSRRWAGIVKPRQLFEQAEVSERKDGSVDLAVVANNLEEIAGWVASRGEGVTVLEPEKLREMVIDLAKGSLRNYDRRFSQ